MSRVLAVARNTIREVLRERIVLVLAIFGAALVFASQVLSPLALGEGKKVVTDFGLAGSSLLAMLRENPRRSNRPTNSQIPRAAWSSSINRSTSTARQLIC